MSDEKFTWKQLRELAVSPGEDGAYSGQPSDPRLGLHVHGYDPDEVHVIVDDGKLAEVTPAGTRILISNTQTTQYQEAYRNRLPDPWTPGW